jgi:hypothetical protein
MPTYRVSIRRPTTNPPLWDWMQTVVAANQGIAVGQAYANWQNSQPNPPAPALGSCQTQANLVGQTRALAATAALGDASGISSSQQAYIKSIEDQIGTLLAAKLDGQFRMVNYPAGFNYGITYGANAYWNRATLQDIDTLLGIADSGMTDLTGGGFSNLYAQVMGAVSFSFSTQDQNTMNAQDTTAEAQIASILTEFTSAGGTFSNPLPLGGKLQDVFNQLTKQYSSLDKLPDTLNALRNAIVAYKAAAANSYALHNRWFAATARIAAAQTNTATPSASNGGMQVDTSGFYVGYTPDKLPSANQLIGSLNTPQNSVDVKIDISSFSSAAAQVRVSGSAGFNIPIAGILGISVGGSAAYDLSRYASSSTNITIELNYPGVTLFASMPSVLSTDNSQGWYANDILQELVARSGEDATGYRLQGSEFDVSQLFGAGCAFSRLKTFVISQQPTMTLTFTGADASRVTSDFKANASISVDLFDLFSIGGASASYAVQNVDAESKTGSVIVTFGPPKPSGTIPLQQQVAYVLGGVASYPPNNI